MQLAKGVASSASRPGAQRSAKILGVPGPLSVEHQPQALVGLVASRNHFPGWLGMVRAISVMLGRFGEHQFGPLFFGKPAATTLLQSSRLVRPGAPLSTLCARESQGCRAALYG